MTLEPPHDSRTGDWFYRTDVPLRALAALPDVYCVEVNRLHRHQAQLTAHADVLVLNMVCDADMLPLVEYRRREGLPTIFEINDDIDFVQPWNPTYRFFSDPQQRELLRTTAAACDAVQFSSHQLASRYGRLAQRLAVFPNQMPEGLPPPAPRFSQNFVVGWGGSVGHQADVAAVVPELCAWMRAHDDVRFAVMADEVMRPLFAAFPQDRLRWEPPGTMQDYRAFISTLDVGIAPLQDTGFNRCRSDVKLLEYAAAGAVPVVQRLAPYEATLIEGLTGFGFNTGEELVAALESLHADPSLRSAVASTAYKYVITQRVASSRAQDRLLFYDGLPHKPFADARPRFEVFADFAGATRAGRHLRLEFTLFERLVFEALVAGLQEQFGSTALTLLSKAAALAPDNVDVLIYMALFDAQKRRVLEQAVQKVPSSARAWLELGDAQFDEGDARQALLSFQQAMALAPSYALAWGKAAAVLARAGQHAQAECFALRARALSAAVDLGFSDA
ncbi:MAG: glycosyltransferase [Deltaproteobacteria bacterium]|nr:glycosyltransferase [Deltaproteobacteria bacterium]